MGGERAVGGTTDLLRPFWTDADLPIDRFPYYEFQARRYASIERFLSRYSPWAGRRLLDLGGGVGGLSVVLSARLGGSYDVADYSPPTERHAAALRRRGVDRSFACDLSDAHGLDRLPSGYDAILLVEVLEHLLVNPLRLFRSIWEHLAPDGLFFLTTPNMARVRSRFRLLAGRSVKEGGRYPWDGSSVYGHVIEFTVDELDQLLAAESFERDRAEIVQQVPSVRPTRGQSIGVRLLNTSPARRLRLGDDILAAYRKRPRPLDGSCPIPLDRSGRV
ncbi:MAG TPA: methyltransferase domain-containing protein [Thermoplasmata archaeon]